MTIIGTLPQPFADGGVGEASQVMANFNWIVSQVNANAALGGNAGQWIPLAGAPVPTFINGYSFSVLGDFRTSMPVGTRVQGTLAGGFGYGTVTTVSFGAGATTVVLNLSTGTAPLNSSLSAISFGMPSVVNSSLPASTNLQSVLNSTVIPSTSIAPLANSSSVVGDVLNEWTGINGAFIGMFTAANAGNYLFVAKGFLDANGANLTQLGQFTMRYRLNFGSTPVDQLQNLAWPYATGVQSNKYPFSGQMSIGLSVGDRMQITIQSPLFNAGSMLWTGSVAVRRLPY